MLSEVYQYFVQQCLGCSLVVTAVALLWFLLRSALLRSSMNQTLKCH